MKTSLYAVFGALVLTALTWAHFTGWTPGGITETKHDPKSIRANPGSYRPAYVGSMGRGSRGYAGAK